MQNIVIPKIEKDSLIAQFIALYQVFSKISELERVVFDLSKMEWAYPLLILPISAYIDETESKYKAPKDINVSTYFKTICFPQGVDTVSRFQKSLTYVPITVLRQLTGIETRERLESCFAEMIYKATGEVRGAQDAIYYPISELITNIFEHSQGNKGWMFAQLYPKKKFLDLCIVDTGRGLKTCYKEEADMDLSDGAAIKKAVSGYSTKSSKERGFGIYTSKRIICKALGGSFIMLSGKAGLISQKSTEKLIDISPFNWQGVIIGYRIPFSRHAIDISPFLE